MSKVNEYTTISAAIACVSNLAHHRNDDQEHYRMERLLAAQAISIHFKPLHLTSRCLMYLKSYKTKEEQQSKPHPDRVPLFLVAVCCTRLVRCFVYQLQDILAALDADMWSFLAGFSGFVVYQPRRREGSTFSSWYGKKTL